jgi:hypothetical protein
MHRFLLLSIPLFVSLLAGTPTTSLAAGFGPYFEYVGSSGEVDLDGVGVELDLDYDSDKYGFGLAIDTNVAADRLFNYRLNLGYQKTNREFDVPSLGSSIIAAPLAGELRNIDGDGLSLNNHFGFGMLRTRDVRLWAGPTLRLGFDVFDTNSNSVDIVDVYAGVGAALGINIHTGSLVSLGITAGYQHVFIGEIIHVDGLANSDNTETIDGREHVGSIHFTIFFRTRSDQFE